MCVVMEATKSTPTTHKELRGSVLDVLRELLSGRRDEDILALVSKLVARNNELELLLAKMRESKNRGERVSSAPPRPMAGDPIGPRPPNSRRCAVRHRLDYGEFQTRFLFPSRSVHVRYAQRSASASGMRRPKSST